jgi:hypothetical protein
MFKLEIVTDNAAFDDDENGELARLLRYVATQLEAGLTEELNLRDTNGNSVGKSYWTEDAA